MRVDTNAPDDVHKRNSKGCHLKIIINPPFELISLHQWELVKWTCLRWVSPGGPARPLSSGSSAPGLHRWLLWHWEYPKPYPKPGDARHRPPGLAPGEVQGTKEVVFSPSPAYADRLMTCKAIEPHRFSFRSCHASGICQKHCTQRRMLDHGETLYMKHLPEASTSENSSPRGCCCKWRMLSYQYDLLSNIIVKACFTSINWLLSWRLTTNYDQRQKVTAEP